MLIFDEKEDAKIKIVLKNPFSNLVVQKLFWQENVSVVPLYRIILVESIKKNKMFLTNGQSNHSRNITKSFSTEGFHKLIGILFTKYKELFPNIESYS